MEANMEDQNSTKGVMFLMAGDQESMFNSRKVTEKRYTYLVKVLYVR